MPNPWISPPSLQSGGVEGRREEGLKGVPGTSAQCAVCTVRCPLIQDFAGVFLELDSVLL